MDDQRWNPRPSDAGTGWAVLGTLISGMVVWGGIGWLVGHLVGWPALMPVGALVGLVCGVYLVYARLSHEE